MGIKGTRTERNLLTAFAGESQARNRYTYFASQAKKEGYEQISGIFLETADNEKEHAKRLFKLMEGGEVQITASFPAGVISDTLTNLKEAAAGENFEHTSMYPEYAKVADEEGFKQIADIFASIANAEIAHENRYRELIKNIEQGKVFRRDEKVIWKCRNCGYLHEGNEPPEVCPACDHPKNYYEVWCEKY